MNALLDQAVEQNTGRHAPIHCILLVDDEIELWWKRDIAALTAAGYDVDTAEDGEAAWNALQTNDYDLLITDNNMPKLWGSDLIERLRNHGMKLPVIFASSLLPVIDPEHRSHFLNVQLLEKPVSASQLLASVEKSTGQEKIPVNEVAWFPEAFRPIKQVQGGIDEKRGRLRTVAGEGSQ